MEGQNLHANHFQMPRSNHVVAAGTAKHLDSHDALKSCLQPDSASAQAPLTERKQKNTPCWQLGPASPTPTPARKAVSKDESVAGLMNWSGSKLQTLQQEQKEAIYASAQREPLGRSASHGYDLRAGLGQQTAFGVPVHASRYAQGSQAKEAMFPTAVLSPNSEQQAHKTYLKSHGSYDPGEQRTRNYDWQNIGIDPATHAFGGQRNSQEPGLMKRAMGSTAASPAKATGRRQQAFNLAHHDHLGRPKRLGASDTSLPAEHTYGKPTLRGEKWGVDRLIQGDYGAAQLQPDADLGRSRQRC